MRISDWSSDVCSSDLGTTGQVLRKTSSVDNDTAWGNPAAAPVDSVFGRTGAVVAASGDYNAGQISETTGAKIMTSAERSKLRSEEHTSELQSLMRISYAVFCLKKTTHEKNKQHNT